MDLKRLVGQKFQKFIPCRSGFPEYSSSTQAYRHVQLFGNPKVVKLFCVLHSAKQTVVMQISLHQVKNYALTEVPSIPNMLLGFLLVLNEPLNVKLSEQGFFFPSKM